MAIPKKGSRPIVVNGVQYRWHERGGQTYRHRLEQSAPIAVVQHAQVPGTVLFIEMPKERKRWEQSHVALPADVACGISRALAKGWKPTERGKPFRVNVEEPS